MYLRANTAGLFYSKTSKNTTNPAEMSKGGGTAEHTGQTAAVRPQWPVCFADITPEPVNTSHHQTTYFFVIVNLHIITSHSKINSTFYKWLACVFSSIQLVWQLLPSHSFINTFGLFIYMGQGPATIRAGASACRPPINTSDTCQGRNFFFTKRETVYSMNTALWVKSPPNALHRCLIACGVFPSLQHVSSVISTRRKWEQPSEHKDYFWFLNS